MGSTACKRINGGNNKMNLTELRYKINESHIGELVNDSNLGCLVGDFFDRIGDFYKKISGKEEKRDRRPYVLNMIEVMDWQTCVLKKLAIR